MATSVVLPLVGDGGGGGNNSSQQNRQSKLVLIPPISQLSQAVQSSTNQQNPLKAGSSPLQTVANICTLGKSNGKCIDADLFRHLVDLLLSSNVTGKVLIVDAFDVEHFAIDLLCRHTAAPNNWQMLGFSVANHCKQIADACQSIGGDANRVDDGDDDDGGDSHRQENGQGGIGITLPFLRSIVPISEQKQRQLKLSHFGLGKVRCMKRGGGRGKFPNPGRGGNGWSSGLRKFIYYISSPSPKYLHFLFAFDDDELNVISLLILC